VSVDLTQRRKGAKTMAWADRPHILSATPPAAMLKEKAASQQARSLRAFAPLREIKKRGAGRKGRSWKLKRPQHDERREGDPGPIDMQPLTA
jgi:hypothetical protein